MLYDYLKIQKDGPDKPRCYNWLALRIGDIGKYLVIV